MVAGCSESSGSEPVSVYFLGSGVLGLPALESLVRDPRIDLVGVGTQPDRPAGRRRRLTPTPLATAAETRGWHVHRVDSVNATEFLDSLRGLAPDMLVVASFGQLLKPPVLALPRHGCLNIHASLLPEYRGAAPIQAAILSGDAETGVSFMRMDKGLDTGPVYEAHRTVISERDTADVLEEKLALLAAEHVADCIMNVCAGGLTPAAQDDERASYAPKIEKKGGAIDWAQPAETIARQVRAMFPWPKAYFRLAAEGGSRRIQVTEAVACGPTCSQAPPGQVLTADPESWTAACGKGALALMRIVPEGRREMDSAAFLRGFPVPVGSSLMHG